MKCIIFFVAIFFFSNTAWCLQCRIVRFDNGYDYSSPFQCQATGSGTNTQIWGAGVCPSSGSVIVTGFKWGGNSCWLRCEQAKISCT